MITAMQSEHFFTKILDYNTMHLLSHESFCKWGCDESNESRGSLDAWQQHNAFNEPWLNLLQGHLFCHQWVMTHPVTRTLVLSLVSHDSVDMLGSSTMHFMSHDSTCYKDTEFSQVSKGSSGYKSTGFVAGWAMAHSVWAWHFLGHDSTPTRTPNLSPVSKDLSGYKNTDFCHWWQWWVITHAGL